MSSRGTSNPAGGSSGGPSQGSGSSSHRKTNSAPPNSFMTQGLGRGSPSNRADKQRNMRKSLGGESTAQGSRDASGLPPKTHLLLVQGGEHTAFLGDFLALIEFFQKQTSPKFAADFWTMYGPEQYFEDPDNAQHTTIKFENRVVANRHNSEHYTPAYTYVHPTQICQRVYQWLHIKSDATEDGCAKSGDSIVLIFLAHGVMDANTKAAKGMRLGNNDMLVDEFVEALRNIPRDVQVNVISTACYSAIFAQKISEDEQRHRWIQVASQPSKEAFPAGRSASARFQNSTFVAGLVRSLAGLGRNNAIDLKTLQTDLFNATQAHPNPKSRSEPFSYSDAPLATQVHSLLLRSFADYPFTPQNSAARRRKELNINMLKRPYPESAALMDKEVFAASMIAEEQDSFGSQATRMLEDKFGDLPFTDHTRKIAAGDILRGMLIRGRLQAAVFDIFMQLCLQGVCSLSSLEHPVDWVNWPSGDNCFAWILRMLAVFSCFQTDWHSVQESWGIPPSRRWHDYTVPFIWLGTMIGRSFTSLDVVFDIIRLKGQLGPVNSNSLEKLVANQPRSDWKPDINLNRPQRWYGSGTFACWLPEDIDASITQQGFDDAAMALSQQFYFHLERTETHYMNFFNISKADFDSDVQRGERDVRDWVREG
ncbi:hypothetical protein VF21_08230 [Pseudogymnoascus sp. 05NY08]|nr:hypothetical protein VF21_08230 [Pseudogymnoascus sp. 05NY08]